MLATGRDVDEDDEWRLVTATGSYLTDETVVVRYRTRKGNSGVDVVVPLQPADGPALLVDRGWLATGNSGAAVVDDVPDPPSGTVTVTGWVRADASGDSARVTDGSTRAISSAEIGPAIGREVYGGFVDLRVRGPGAGDAADEGGAARPQQRPALLLRAAVVVLRGAGRVRLLLPRLRRVADRHGPQARPAPRTARGVRRLRSIPPSTGSITPDTNDEAGESRNAAARPNSSGSP